VTWDQVVAAYTEQIRALLDGGVDTLLVETIFDTLNSKAALFAIESVFDERAYRVPVMISVTITDASGRTLSGQTIGAFYNSVRHTKPFSVGINCALGGRAMRPYVEELASIAECYVTCYPNAGLPNAFGGYDETPDDMAAVLSEFAKSGFINLVGGCCGSTPPHIEAIAKSVRGLAPRNVKTTARKMQLSGLEALSVG
jgi:5-methyltetrahydrofolate--homocysteine methyltransferase